MGRVSVGSATASKIGDVVTILLQMDADAALDLRELLAKANSEGEGNPSRSLRHLLTDIEAALKGAFRPVVRELREKSPGMTADWGKEASEIANIQPRLRPVCMIPDCGCSGHAHP